MIIEGNCEATEGRLSFFLQNCFKTIFDAYTVHVESPQLLCVYISYISNLLSENLGFATDT